MYALTVTEFVNRSGATPMRSAITRAWDCCARKRDPGYSKQELLYVE